MKSIYVLLVLMLLPVAQATIVYCPQEAYVGDNVVVVADTENIVVVGPVLVELQVRALGNYYIASFVASVPGNYQILPDNVTVVVKELKITVVVSLAKVKKPHAKVEVYSRGQLIYTDYTNEEGIVEMCLRPGEYTFVADGKVAKKVDTSVTKVVTLDESGGGVEVPLLGSIPLPVLGAISVVVVFLLLLFYFLKRAV